MRACEIRRSNIGHIGFIPIVAAGGMPGEPGRDLAHPGGVVPCLAAILTDQRQDRHPPQALARDAPVRAGFNHIVDALLTPGGHPLHVVANGGKRALAQIVGIHADEPLRRGPENHRAFAAPAMRIRMGDLALGQQIAGFLQFFNHCRIGFKHVKPGKILHGREKTPFVVQRRIGLQTIFQANFIVLAAMSRRGMHTARAGFQGDMIAENDERGTVIERMARFKTLQGRARALAYNRVPAPAECCGALFQKVAGQYILLAALLHQRIDKLGMHGHGQVVRQSPGCGGPDHDKGAGRVRRDKGLLQSLVRQREADEHGRRGMIGVFHLGFGQGRPAVAAPVDGLLAAHDLALLHKGGQFGSGDGLIGRLHGHIRIGPVAQNAQALEFPALDVEKFLRVLAAAFADRMSGQILFPVAQFHFHIMFDGQPVTVPAGHIGRGPAQQIARLDHNILENLVQRRAQMNMTVGIGRAVMQHIPPPFARSFLHETIGVRLFPELQRLRFLLDKVRLHRKPGIRQIEGRFIFSHGHILRA